MNNNNININEISFKSKDCKKENHFSCNHRWEGFGFKIICNCECHRKQLLEKNIIYFNSSNKKTVRLES